MAVSKGMERVHELTVFLAVPWVITGVIEVVAALKGRSRPTRRLEIVSGVLGAAAAVLATIKFVFSRWGWARSLGSG